MKWMRGPAAVLTFLVGFLMFTVGISLAIVTGISEIAAPTLDKLVMIGIGVGAAAVGFLFLCISRAIDGDRGPVKDYRERRRKPQA